MSLNTVTLSPTQTPPLQLGESLLTPGYTADIELRIPATIEGGPKRNEYAKGRIWVTDQRVIFVSEPSTSSSSAVRKYDGPPVLESLVIPYSTLLSCTFNLPLLSPNNLLIAFLPSPPSPDSPLNPSQTLPSPGRGGKLEVKIVVGEGAGHGVWKRIEGERGRYVERQREEETLPVYTPKE